MIQFVFLFFIANSRVDFKHNECKCSNQHKKAKMQQATKKKVICEALCYLSCIEMHFA